jgi:hypothetical protein
VEQDQFLAAVRTAWVSELGEVSSRTTWHAAGGDSVGIISFLLELEKILGRNVPIELISSEMEPSSLAWISTASN